MLHRLRPLIRPLIRPLKIGRSQSSCRTRNLKVGVLETLLFGLPLLVGSPDGIWQRFPEYPVPAQLQRFVPSAACAENLNCFRLQVHVFWGFKSILLFLFTYFHTSLFIWYKFFDLDLTPCVKQLIVVRAGKTRIGLNLPKFWLSINILNILALYAINYLRLLLWSYYTNSG